MGRVSALVIPDGDTKRGRAVGPPRGQRYPKQFYESSTKPSVRARVDERVDAAVGVAQPEDHLKDCFSWF